VDTLIATFLPTGAVSYLYYADRLNQLPLGVIGVAVGTVLLPRLSRQLGAGDAAAASDSQNRALEYVLVLTLPAVTAFLVVAGPIVDALFRRGAFSAADAAATAGVLRAYALGLPAFVLIKCLIPGFFARSDTATPVKIAGAAVAVNIVLKVALMAPLGPVGLALATSAAAWTNCGLLALILWRRGHFAPDRRLRGKLPRMLAAATGTAAALAAADFWLVPLAGGLPGGLSALVGLALVVVAGAVAYVLLAFAAGLFRPSEMRRLRRRA
jgi:putative peptidoglycan lipid II flippase